MKKTQIGGILFLTASIAFYAAAIIAFAGSGNNATGVMWLALGSASLCLGSVFLRRFTSNNDKKDP